MLALLAQGALLASLIGATLLPPARPRHGAPSLKLFTVDQPAPRPQDSITPPPPLPLAASPPPTLPSPSPSPSPSPAVIVAEAPPPAAINLATGPLDAPGLRMSRSRQAFVTLAPAGLNRPVVTSAATLRADAWRDVAARLAAILVDQPPLYLAVRVNTSGEVVDMRIDGTPPAADMVPALRASLLGARLFAIADARQADYWQALPPLAPGAAP